MTSSEPINSLWIGDGLGAVERACLKSVLAQGHRFTLWCYRRPEGVPPGVEVRDAAEILPQDRIIRHRSGSVSLFSNWFRYELQRRGLGVWIDCDVYFVRPLEALPEHLFAWAAPNQVCTAVMRLPPDSPLIPPLLALFEERTVPPWLPWVARLTAHYRLRRTGRSGLSRMPWGSAGPNALTHYCRAYGLDRQALPSDTFYPMHWNRAAWVLDPRLGLDDVATPRTVAVHLWNELIKGFKNEPAPAGSFLARLQQEGAS